MKSPQVWKAAVFLRLLIRLTESRVTYLGRKAKLGMWEDSEASPNAADKQPCFWRFHLQKQRLTWASSVVVFAGKDPLLQRRCHWESPAAKVSEIKPT